MVSRAHETTKPVLVIADDVIVRAAGAPRNVVTERVFDNALPFSLRAVTKISYGVFGKRLPKVAEVFVDEVGVAALPFNVYV